MLSPEPPGAYSHYFRTSLCTYGQWLAVMIAPTRSLDSSGIAWQVVPWPSIRNPPASLGLFMTLGIHPPELGLQVTMLYSIMLYSIHTRQSPTWSCQEAVLPSHESHLATTATTHHPCGFPNWLLSLHPCWRPGWKVLTMDSRHLKAKSIPGSPLKVGGPE